MPLVQLPPAGHYNDNGRDARFVKDPRPLPDAARRGDHRPDAATSRAFGPASKRDIASWAGVAQRDFDFDAIPTVSYQDEQGPTLLDLPDQPLPPADTQLPPRLLAHWDQPLLAYKDRDRIIPPELQPLQLTLSGDSDAHRRRPRRRELDARRRPPHDHPAPRLQREAARAIKRSPAHGPHLRARRTKSRGLHVERHGAAARRREAAAMTLIDATSVINPYAAELVRHRVRIGSSHPAEHLARYVGVPASRVTVTNGARDALRTLLTGPVLLSLPTCPAYYDLVRGPVVVNQLSLATTSGSTSTRSSTGSSASSRRRS